MIKTACTIAKIGAFGVIDSAIGILRQRGFRINLRFAAEYSMMVLLFIRLFLSQARVSSAILFSYYLIVQFEIYLVSLAHIHLNI